MTFASNSGFLAIAFMAGSAAFILLILYWLLLPSFPARFFRYWLVGWTFYTAFLGLRIFSLWRGGPNAPPFGQSLSFLAAVFFLAAVLDCRDPGKPVWKLWPLWLFAVSDVAALGWIGQAYSLANWSQNLLECSLYLCAGWFFWRSDARHRGVGWKLLAGALLLRGLHGLDQPDWAMHSAGLFRVSFHGLFGVMMGIAMTVLVLEAGRGRTEDLNEKLRRLSLITAEATQSLRVEEVLQGVLLQLVESLGGTHGLVFLVDDVRHPPALACRGSVGFSERFRKQNPHVSADEPWLRQLLAQEKPLSLSLQTKNSTARSWMENEKLATLMLIRIPGKEEPSGFLGIGYRTPRAFERDEQEFVVNVANLLGLTAQNVELFQNAATARRQWLDTFDSIDDLILVHSLDGTILRANRALADRLGVELATLVGSPVRKVLRSSRLAWSRCPYCEGVAGKADEVDPSFGGYFLASDSPLHDSEGGYLGTIHVLKDFTDRRQAENKFRNLFEKVQEGIFISAPDGRFLDFNDAFMRILGYESHDELLQADIPEQFYVNPADRDRRQRLLNEYGEVTDFEFQFRRHDGDIRTAHESSFVTRSDSGVITAYQGFLLDVTDQKQAELDVRQRNRALLALNTIGEILGQSQSLEEGLTASLSKVAELFAADFGTVYLLDEATNSLKRAAAIGCRSNQSARPEPIAIPAPLLEQIRQAHATLLSGSLPTLPEALREFHEREGIQSSQVAVLWAKDSVVGALVIGSREMRSFSTAELNLLSAVGNQIATTIDKSVLLEKTREAYDSLRRTQEQLLQSEKMAAVGQLISGVAHELNNPLTAILGYTQLLKSDELVLPRGLDYIEKLYKQAQRTHHIVQNLLSFARQQKPQRAAVQINQILEETLILREFDMKHNNIVIRREFDAQLPPTGGDFHQLEQVFLNILNNAVDAIQETGAPGEITIRTEFTGSRLSIEFRDNGPGVTNPHRIFDPFYTTKPVGKGTGLGLSICYGIVKEHGGEIRVRNVEPRGAAFTVTLPLLAVVPAESAELASPVSTVSGS